MPVPLCTARVVLIAPNLEAGREAARVRAEYSHAFVIAANDPSSLNRMKGRVFAGWVLLPGAEHRASGRRIAQLIEFARRFECGCPLHFPTAAA